MVGSDPVSPRWRKSSYSGGGNDDNCVEVANVPAAIAIRDSKEPLGGMLAVPGSSWKSFCADLRPKQPTSR